MTDGMHTREVGPDAYPKAFLNALNNPRQLWDTAFRTHIPAKCRHLLFSLFFCSEYGVEIDELRGAFEALHPLLCHQYNIAQDIKDFEEALKILEGGFVSISSGRVTFINPSVRDYLTDYLDDAALLGMFAKAAQKADWAEAVWRHATKAAAKSAEQQRALGAAEHNQGRPDDGLNSCQQSTFRIVRSDGAKLTIIASLGAQERGDCTIALSHEKHVILVDPWITHQDSHRIECIISSERRRPFAACVSSGQPPRSVAVQD
jgi:hypothetical protein